MDHPPPDPPRTLSTLLNFYIFNFYVLYFYTLYFVVVVCTLYVARFAFNWPPTPSATAHAIAC